VLPGVIRSSSHRGGGKEKLAPAAEFSVAGQCVGTGQQPSRLRRFRPSVGWAGAAPPLGQGTRTFSKVLYETARRENMTLSDLYNLTAAARGHWVLCGTPARVADTLEEWFLPPARRMAYNILPPYFPGAFDDFVDLVVRSCNGADCSGATTRA